jgi:eight-cysteine-cluster-containing protein
MRRHTFLLPACLALVSFAGCAVDQATEPEPRPSITKEEAKGHGGKGDGVDWCDWMGWYGDGVCDDWCPEPDPDCGGGGVPCGDTTCGDGMVCCNDSCGICTPPGGACIQLACGPEEQICGGFAGAVCPSDEYCDYADGGGGACGIADGTGVCKPRPDACIEIYAPVCGCDGRSYGNECEANLMGTDVVHSGPCSGDREVASGACVKNTFDSCTSDADCVAGGCGGELCFNPAESGGFSTCECTTPTGPSGCGCVNGQCAWYN